MDDTPSRAIVRAGQLLAIEPIQSTEETRYYLNGSYIIPHPDGAVLIATDGHLMAIVFAQGAHVAGLPQIWKPQAKARLAKMIAEAKKDPRCHRSKDPWDVWTDLRARESPALGPSVSLVLAENVQQVLDGKGETLISLPGPVVIDGTFPEWTRVFNGAVPTDAPTQSWAINAGLSKRIADFGVALSESGDKKLPIRYWNCGTGPLRVTFEGCPATLLVMPIRDGHEDGKFVELPWISDLLGPADNVVPLRQAA